MLSLSYSKRFDLKHKTGLKANHEKPYLKLRQEFDFDFNADRLKFSYSR